MFERILAPLDGSVGGVVALRLAERIADIHSAELEVISLLTVGDDLDERRKVVQEQTASLHHRFRAVVRPVVYTVADEIADEFELEENTLVVMSTTARPRAGGIIGSTAEDLLDFIHQPVLLLGPKAVMPQDWPAGPMFVCTDGSEVAESILPGAAEMATGLDMHPWILTVVEPAPLPKGTSVGAESNYPASVARTLGATVGRQVDFDVLHNDDPATAIIDYANNREAAMIALATHGRTGIRRLAMGSVAIKVVHEATCPVLVSHPKESD